MIVPNPTDKGFVDVSGDEHDPLLVDTNSTLDPPPAFSDVPQPGPSHLVGSASIESPPEFALYDADYFETSNGDIVSHDPHLNSDGRSVSIPA